MRKARDVLRPLVPLAWLLPASVMAQAISTVAGDVRDMGYTGATLDWWIQRWIGPYRDVTYRAREGGGEEEPPARGE